MRIAVEERRRVALVVLVSVLILASGCQGVPLLGPDRPDGRAERRSGAPERGTGAGTAAPIVAVSPADGARKVRTDRPVSVSVAHGTLRSVRVIAGNGSQVEGRFTPDRRRWTSEGELRRNARYRVEVTAQGEDGRRSTTTHRFQTLRSAEILEAEVSPEPGTYGVGIPIVVTFTNPVHDKAGVERRMTVTTSRPVTGAWHWFGDREVHYRPKSYWPAGTKVELALRLNDVSSGAGSWGVEDSVHRFSIGRSVVTKVDLFRHTARTYLDGRLARTMPVTGGKKGWETRNGTKVVLSKSLNYRFRSTAINAPETYDLLSRYAIRVTWSGEFLHTAWWSTWAHGRRNVSHGCVGLNTENSGWLWRHTQVGDPVEVRSDGDPMPVSGNGWGDWNLSWSEWKAGSALAEDGGETSGAPVVAGPGPRPL